MTSILATALRDTEAFAGDVAIALGKSSGVLDATGAISLHGIVLGAAQQALKASPELSIAVTLSIDIMQPLLAEIAAHDTAAPAVVKALVNEANKLLLIVAPVISVTPNLV